VVLNHLGILGINNRQKFVWCLLQLVSSFGFFSDPEDGGDMFLGNGC
jgi:hypothetical protein